MPQIFQVLRCYKCLVFQVHQTKKSNKWECKLCGEKQSVKRHYGIGTAKDCRIHVQKLNGMRREINEPKNNHEGDSENTDNEENVIPIVEATYQPLKDSKWSNYVEEPTIKEENCNENTSLGDAEIVLEIPKKRKKQFSNNFKRKSIAITTVDHKKVQQNYNNCASFDIAPVILHKAISMESKLSQPDLQSRDFAFDEECVKTSKSIIKNKFIPPVLNKNSKWAQFTDATEENEETEMEPLPSIESSQNDLFSLCDDSDLDNVLNI